MSKKFLQIMTLSVAISSLGNINSISAGAESTEALCTKKLFKGTCKSANCLYLNANQRSGLKNGCHSVSFYREQKNSYTIDEKSSGENALDATRVIKMASTRCTNECVGKEFECLLDCACAEKCNNTASSCREKCTEISTKTTCLKTCEEKKKTCNLKVCGIKLN